MTGRRATFVAKRAQANGAPRFYQGKVRFYQPLAAAHDVRRRIRQKLKRIEAGPDG